MLAACDTFRAGAVEQLKTHTKNLGIHLFEQGYGKDAALLCSAALKYAQANAYDVVLIDTAGRMQDNEPLMRSLSKLVVVNKPDLVLFVGEALAGNDSIHQLTKFNQSLIDYAPMNVRQASVAIMSVIIL
jgi:signal recognition particle receptor subunit alpha